MARAVRLRHKDSGILRNGYYGFSWTTLCFGFFPALFRSDFITFIGGFTIIALIEYWSLSSVGSVGFWIFGINWYLMSGLIEPFLPSAFVFMAVFAWAFIYNGYYTKKLLEKGYIFDDRPDIVSDACEVLGVSVPRSTYAEANKTEPMRSEPRLF